MSKLTDKQELFCHEFLVDLNATQAAIRAGYSEKTANRIASENLSKPVIQARIAELMKERTERTKIDADYVLQRHKEIDELDVLDILKNDLSGFRPLNEWPKAWRTSISGVDIAEMFDYKEGEKSLAGLIKKIKWPDKTKNLETLGKHVDVQAYSEKVEHSGNASTVMVVPSCTSVEDWEKHAQKQHKESLGE